MKLYRYELKKIVTARWLMILFAVMLLLNGVITGIIARDTPQQAAIRATYELYLQEPQALKDYYDELTQLAALHRGEEGFRLPTTYCEGTVFDDRFILRGVLERAEYVEGHRGAMERIKTLADRRIADLGWLGLSSEDYEIRAQQAVGQRYESLAQVVDRSGEYAYGYDAYLESVWVIFFCLLFTTVVGVYVFRQEKAEGSAQILWTTERGRLRTVLAKMAAAVSVSIGGGALLLGTTALAVGLTCGYSSPFQAVQALPSLSTVPNAWNILEYLMIHALLCLVACTVYCLLISAVASMRLSYVACFGVGVLFLGVQFLLFLYPYEGTIPDMRYLNLAAMLEGDTFLSFYRTIAMGSVPVPHITVLMVVSLLLIALLAVLTSVLFCHKITINFPVKIKKATGQVRRLQKNKHIFPRRYGKPLCFYELKKTRFGMSLLLIVLLLAAKCFYIGNTAGDMVRYEEAQYRYYITHIQDMEPSERVAYMTAERERLDKIITAYGANKEAFELGNMDSKSYFAYMDIYYGAVAEDSVFQMVENYASYIDYKNQATGLDGDILYTRGYEVFFGYETDWFLFAALLILCGNVFAVEYQKTGSRGESASMIRTTAGGRRRTVLAKLVSFSVIGMILAVLFRLAGLIVVATRYDLPNPRALLYTIQSFDVIDSGISIGGYFAMDFLLQALCGILLSLAVCAVSGLCRKLPLTLCTLLIGVGLPVVLIEWVWPEARGIGFLSLTSPQMLTKLSARLDLWSRDMTVLVMVVVAYIALVSLLTMTALQRYAGRQALKKQRRGLNGTDVRKHK